MGLTRSAIVLMVWGVLFESSGVFAADKNCSQYFETYLSPTIQLKSMIRNVVADVLAENKDPAGVVKAVYFLEEYVLLDEDFIKNPDAYVTEWLRTEKPVPSVPNDALRTMMFLQMSGRLNEVATLASKVSKLSSHRRAFEEVALMLSQAFEHEKGKFKIVISSKPSMPAGEIVSIDQAMKWFQRKMDGSGLFGTETYETYLQQNSKKYFSEVLGPGKISKSTEAKKSKDGIFTTKTEFKNVQTNKSLLFIEVLPYDQNVR